MKHLIRIGILIIYIILQILMLKISYNRGKAASFKEMKFLIEMDTHRIS